ncbi:MAG: lantibiotic dehydratase, partial [Terriglobia bacterium]
MNNFGQGSEREIKPAGFFVIRSPLLPWDELENWGEGLEAAGAEASHLAEALRRDFARLREGLRIAMLRPEVREALFVSSSDLEAELKGWLQDPDTERGRRVELALARYYQRMCGRATPFGMCAGFSLGTLPGQTVEAVVRNDSALLAGFGDGQLCGTLGTRGEGHDL